MRTILPAAFFKRDARIVAKDLIGTYLVRPVNGKTNAYKIIETEAYLDGKDLASHARSGMTKRNFPMFGAPGHWYVYFTYGMHYMLNIVTGPEGKPSAVLIRGVESISGPARLTKALKIDKQLNTKAATKASGLWIEDRGEKVSPRRIKKTARIGVAYAGEWALKEFRHVLTSSERSPLSQKKRL
jgi:DNA-3-methyladenine glycosylase